ncbi:unnamed protein product [Rotaria magnacalcarata]|nr:unnamed protein product [Rotaria magnacalcarata]CAF4128872.1 unnamed protein product [Rotaria magnacalcarata]
MSRKKKFTDTTIHELSVADNNDKDDCVGDINMDEKNNIQRTHRFEVDHLKIFFEQEMGAREVDYGETMAGIVRQFAAELSEEETDTPFYMVNLSHFARQYLRWNHYLSRIRPFYAVKSNPNGFIIRVLNELGAGFDCASVEELDVVRDQCGSNFDCASNIIYAHPCKPVSQIHRFRNAGVQFTVVDNKDELKKISVYWPEAKVLLRLRPDDAHSLNPLSSKFGASEHDCIEMLRLGRKLNIDLIGCTFHVGSRCCDAQIYAESIRMARRIFDVACSNEFGYKFQLLDIGGGFMGHHSEEPTLPKVAALINNTLNSLFPENEGVRLMSEPGRYFSSSGMTLVCRIIGRRIVTQSRLNQEILSSPHSLSPYSGDDTDSDANSIEQDEDDAVGGVCDDQPLPALAPLPAFSWAQQTYVTTPKIMWMSDKKNIYYINDGIYGTFNAIIFDQKTFITHYLRMSSPTEDNEKDISGKNEKHFKSVIFGPTCDSLDCVAHAIDLPVLNNGDILWFPDVGSYTCSSASNFNGFKTTKYVLFWNK